MNAVSYPYDDPHRQVQRLLPWYVSGAIDVDDMAIVKAHLPDCAECRSDIEWEQSLAREMSTLRMDEGHGWAVPRDNTQPPKSPRRPRTAPPALFRGPSAGKWALAAQAASVVLMAGLALAAARHDSGRHPSARYEALGSAPALATGNMIIMFDPATSEANLRSALVESNARLVDGPTTSGAYLAHAPANTRGVAIDRLKANTHVILAEPLDPPT
jgi:anti-sigma factor RsiW